VSFEPYEPPAPYRDARPAVIVWFRVYAATMTLLSLALLAFVVMSAASLLLCAGFAAVAGLYGVATFVPFRPWGWTLGLVAIAFGLAGGGAMFAIPLLMFWFKPQVKAAFARL
jgi:hypothetical protein